MKNTIHNRVPTVREAELMLKEAERLNPGPWVDHSLYTGKAAKLIAELHPELDANTALVLGKLHDIGRRFGVTSMRHSIDGYKFTLDKGYDLLAKICITHSFPYKNVESGCGKWDCSNSEIKFVENYLMDTEFDEYDKLIQLCDALALPNGFSLLEKRMVDVALRNGVNEYIVSKWKATFEIQQHFERIIGKSIYSILPGVVENTFKF